MKTNIHIHLHGDSEDEILRLLRAFQSNQEKNMAKLDDEITSLRAEIATNTSVEKSALALILGFNQKLADAVAAAKAEGATDTQLAALVELQNTLGNNDAELAKAVADNTSAPPPPPPPPPPPA